MKRLWYMQGPLREAAGEGEGGGDGAPAPLTAEAVNGMIADALKPFKGLDKKLKGIDGLTAALEELKGRIPAPKPEDDTDEDADDAPADKKKGKGEDGLTPAARERIRKAEQAAQRATEAQEAMKKEALERAAKMEAKDRESQITKALTNAGLDLIEGAVDLALPKLLSMAKRLDPADIDSDVVVGDDDRPVAAFIKDWLTEGQGKALVKAPASGGSGHRPSAASGKGGFDLDSYQPGRATPEQTKQLKEALKRLSQ